MMATISSIVTIDSDDYDHDDHDDHYGRDEGEEGHLLFRAGKPLSDRDLSRPVVSEIIISLHY